MSISKSLRIAAIILAVSVACLVVLISAAFFLWIKVYVPYCRQRAEERWTAIGRPMPDLAKRLKPIAENESLRLLTRDLQPFGIRSFYKARQGEQNPNSINVPKQITDAIDPSNLARADRVDLAGQDFSYLDQHAADLDRLYQGLLQRQPAVWNFVPQDGLTLRVPSYLAARNVSQLIWVDALRKLERGDQKKAADAISAASKMTSNIREQPILVSQMIGAAIDGYYASIIVRLPEDPEAIKRLSADVIARREMWRKAVQTEVWSVMNCVDYMGKKPEAFSALYETASPLRKFYISFLQSYEQADCSRFISGAADIVAISDEARELALTDLGATKFVETAAGHAPILTATERFGSISSIFRPDWLRSWIRLNAILLLREQAELIRASRAMVQLGKSGNLGEPESVVIPGAKWLIIGNAAANSVSLKLTPAPAWTANREIIPENFFLLPLDGSKSWTFRPHAVASSGGSLASRISNNTN